MANPASAVNLMLRVEASELGALVEAEAPVVFEDFPPEVVLPEPVDVASGETVEVVVPSLLVMVVNVGAIPVEVKVPLEFV